MGEAKRRKSTDPTYGQPRRGLVVSPPLVVQGSRIELKDTHLDPQELRFALLFWDKLVWPISRSIRFDNNPDEQFLEINGTLRRPEFTNHGDGAQGLVKSQVNTFLDLDRREPGVWSLSQGENSFLIKDKILQEGNGVFVELHRAIPVPDKDVPLNDVLEFRTKRYSELAALRAELDDFVLKVNDAGHADLTDCIFRVDAACADALKAGKEWRFPVRFSNMKASLDLRPFSSIAAGIVGWSAGATYNMPLATSLLFGAAASFKIGGDFGFQQIRPRQGPYRYMADFHQQLF